MQQTKPSITGRFFAALKSVRGGVLVLLTLLLLAEFVDIALQHKPAGVNTESVMSLRQIEAAPAPTDHFPRLSDTETLPWQAVSNLSDWGRTWARHAGVVWYRAKFQRTATQLTQQALFVKRISVGGVLYLNGKELDRTDVYWPPKNAFWFSPKLWRIPDGALTLGDNTLYIAVYGLPGVQPGIDALRIGDAAELEKTYTTFYVLQQYGVVFALILAFLSGMLCLFWALTIKDGGAAFWQGVTLLSMVIFLGLLQEDVYYFLGRQFSLEMMMHFIFVSVALMGVTFLMAGLRFYRLKFHGLERNVWIGFSILVVLCFMVPAEYSRLVRVFVYSVTMLVIIGTSYLIQWMSWRPDSKLTEKLFALTYLSYPVVGVHDIATILGYTTQIQMLIVFGIPFVCAITVGLYGWAYFQARLEIQEVKEKLLREVARANLALEQSLSAAHQTNITQAQAHERLQFWRDIHDGFSGALTGTIALIEHRHFDAAQAAQLLRAMREELVLSVKAGEETYQSLEEILQPVMSTMTERLASAAIELVWQVPVNLMVRGMIALHLPLIVREALINVLKHSNATQVVCILRLANHSVTGFIQDNGSRLAPPKHSPQISNGIGLNSIRQRIAQMKGKFFWDQLPHSVTLQFSIPLPHNTVRYEALT